MTTQDQWRDPTGPLKKLASEFHFEAEKLEQNERPDALSYTDEKFDAGKLALPEDEKPREEKLVAINALMLELREKYGPSLTLQFKMSTGPLFTLDDNYDRPKLEKFYEEIKDAYLITLDLKIDKSKLIPYWKLTHESVITRLFLYPEALVRVLSLPLTKLELGDEALFKGVTGEKKVLILVPDHDEIELDGEYLAVLGGAAVANWRKHIPSTAPDIEKVKFLYDEASEKLRWVQFNLEHLTPLHLKVTWKKPEDGTEGGPSKDDRIARALYCQLFACSLLYMAGYSSLGSGKDGGQAAAGPRWVATFAADKYLTRFDIGDTDKLAEALNKGGGDKPWKAALSIAKLAAWSYDVEKKRGVADRLSVLQNIIASSLQGNDSSINCCELATQAEEIYTRAEVRHESFIQKELDKYLSQVKELEDAVELTTKGYNEQVQSLTKSLTENMLAAVAVVVGSFIAAVFKSPFEANVFLFGTSIYVVYLMIFPVGVGLFSAWQRFNDSKDSFDKRQKEFARRLTEAEVKRIVGGTVTKRESWFKRWFLATSILYVLVLGSVVLAINVVPGLIKSWGDRFELREVSYGEPTTGDVVPLIIRGEKFDKDKEIVVTIGDSKFTNTDGQTLKVHGSTVLALAPRRKDLAAITDDQARFVSVRQGLAGPESRKLPEGIPPIQHPVFDKWKRVAAQDGTVSLEASGSNYDSISEIGFGGAKLEFNVSNNGGKLDLYDRGSLTATDTGQTLDVTLKNGEKMKVKVSVPTTPPKSAAKKVTLRAR